MIYCGDMNLIRVVIDSYEYNTASCTINNYYDDATTITVTGLINKVYEDPVVETPLFKWGRQVRDALAGLMPLPVKQVRPGLNTYCIHPP